MWQAPAGVRCNICSRSSTDIELRKEELAIHHFELMEDYPRIEINAIINVKCKRCGKHHEDKSIFHMRRGWKCCDGTVAYIEQPRSERLVDVFGCYNVFKTLLEENRWTLNIDQRHLTSSDSVSVTCPIGHVGNRSYSSFSISQSCIECQRSLARTDLSVIMNAFKKCHLTPCSLETQYKNRETKLDYTCNMCNGKNSICFKNLNIKKFPFCPSCVQKFTRNGYDIGNAEVVNSLYSKMGVTPKM
jgi:hypothetical protein